jgi:glycerol-3-phosphate dehydrogenase
LTNLRYRYALVVEALRERRYFLDTAPHLSQWLPIMIPLQKWWQAPYFWAGTKFYDFLAGSENIESSYFLTKSKALDAFPMLKKEGLVGALVYYGMFDTGRVWNSANDIRWCTQRLPHERFPRYDGRTLRRDCGQPSRNH